MPRRGEIRIIGIGAKGRIDRGRKLWSRSTRRQHEIQRVDMLRLADNDPRERDAEHGNRTPCTYMEDVKCPMLMIQGRDDPRVVERETTDVVERLRAGGVPVDYLVFEDEGHDLIRVKNRIACYNRIASFFAQHLKA